MLTGEVNDMLRELIEILQASGDGWNDTVPISAPENGGYSFTDWGRRGGDQKAGKPEKRTWACSSTPPPTR